MKPFRSSTNGPVAAFAMVTLLAYGGASFAEPISEIVVFDARQSNPGGASGLIWTKWLASQYGIPTPTVNGTAYWVTPLSDLSSAVTDYLNDHSPTNETLIVVGTLDQVLV